MSSAEVGPDQATIRRLEEPPDLAEYPLPEELPSSPTGSFACNPMQIVTAAMVGGNWIGVPWFVFNAFALEGPTKRRELLFAALLPVATMAAGMGIIALVVAYRLPIRVAHYAIILVFVAKLALLYQLEKLQSATLKIHAALSRRTMDGVALLFLAYVARSAVISAAFDVSPWLGWAVL